MNVTVRVAYDLGVPQSWIRRVIPLSVVAFVVAAGVVCAALLSGGTQT